jgi:hypothetical protein
MIDTLNIFHELQETLDTRAAEKIAEIIGKVYDELHNTVTKEEFRELTTVVRELSEAQHRTEARLEKLTQAQERTEACLEKLAQAQERADASIAKLAAAQSQTEKAIQQLTEDLRQTRQEVFQKLDQTNTEVGGLSATVGYGLEDKAYQYLPGLLSRDFGITVEGSLHRRFIQDNKGKDLEVNIFCAATQSGKHIHIVGEAKSQLSKKKIDEFIRKKLKRLEGLYLELFPILITHMISSATVAAYAEKKGIHLYYSYDFVS